MGIFNKKVNKKQTDFLKEYKISEKITKESTISYITKGKISITTGIYNNGLISILDTDITANIIKNWGWKFQKNFIPIISTAFGDLFMYNTISGECYFYQIQYDTFDLITDSLDELLNNALIDNGIITHVLFKDKFSDVFITIGHLKYGETYILKPWLMLGGKDVVENYSIGSLTTYLELVSKSLEN